MAHFHDNVLIGASGQGSYQIERSLRFNSADSAYLSRTNASTGTSRRIFTISLWLKRTAIQGSLLDFGFINAGGDGTTIGIDGTGAFGFNGKVFLRNGGGSVGSWSPFVRDTSAWYHFVVAIDTTQATASDRQKLYINGVDQGACSGSLTLNVDTSVNHNVLHLIGAFNGPAAGYYANGYLAEYHLIDGQALTPNSFGETDAATGVWKPKKYTGTYGTNGFYLNFADNSGTTSTTLGKDNSGNGNNFTPNNFSVTAGAGNDSLIDTPTPYADGGNGRGNYCTWLPQQGGQTWTFRNGNLDAVNGNSGAAAYSCVGTFGMSSGKWYFEVKVNDNGGTTSRVPGVGIMGIERDILNATATVRPDIYLSGNGSIDNSAGTQLQTGFGNATAGDIVGVAVDADAKSVQFYRNGSTIGTATTYTASTVLPSFYSYINFDCNANFGQRPFEYTPPSGFLALNTQNLPQPTIKKPSNYVNPVLYTGTGSAQTVTTSLGFSPDLVWIKGRSGATNHAIYDTQRGTQFDLSTNTTGAETTESEGLTSFNSNGFDIGTLAKINTNAATYVAWCWKAGVTPGFDMITYTGTSVAGALNHGLGVSPKMIIVKSRSQGTTGYTGNWYVYHASNTAAPETDYLLLNTGAATADLNTIWNDTAPTSTTFTIGTNAAVNNSGDSYIAYLFSEVEGFSKFGSYTGNGNADGPFVFCGFRPAVVIVKMSSSTGNWTILDSKREGYNVDNDPLFPNLANAEGTTDLIDITSNGFKVRTTDATFNTNTGTYIFVAFAESPFKYSLAR